MDKKPIDYLAESEKYKPVVVYTLLVGEAPPPSGTKYFYVPRAMSNRRPIERDASLPATIFNHYFRKRPETENEYTALLYKLKARGIFLMDIIDKPLRIRDSKAEGGINQENLRMLIKEIPRLRERIKSRGISIDDGNIIFLLPRLHYRKELQNEFPKSRMMRWIDFRTSPE